MTAKEYIKQNTETIEFAEYENQKVLDIDNVKELIKIVKKEEKDKFKNKKCSNCKHFDIKSDEHGICENPKNDFSLRFNASKKGFEMLKDDVKLIDFINEIEPYTTFYIHQNFGCINFSA